MLTTGCEGCCFLKQDTKGRGCVLNQACMIENGQIFAPGYCRMCRSHKWAQKQDDKDITKLVQKVIEDNVLKMDLLVFFDEAVHSLKNLQRTLDTDWYIEHTKNIIIVDVTGFGKRQNLALQYLKNKKCPIPIVVDSSVLNESATQWELTIKRLSSKIIAPFFMTMPAGSIIHNMPLLSKTVQYIPNRVIHWSFPVMIGSTIVVSDDLRYGLFITKPYRALTKSSEAKSFSQQLITEEAETRMKLSWFCSGCGLA